MYTMSFTALTGIQNYSLTPDLNLCPSSWNEMGIPSVSLVQGSELFLKSFTGGSCRGQSSTISTSCMGSRCIKEYECLKFWTTFCTKNHVTLPFKMSWMDTRPLSTCGLFSKGASVFLILFWVFSKMRLLGLFCIRHLCSSCTKKYL